MKIFKNNFYKKKKTKKKEDVLNFFFVFFFVYSKLYLNHKTSSIRLEKTW